MGIYLHSLVDSISAHTNVNSGPWDDFWTRSKILGGVLILGNFILLLKARSSFRSVILEVFAELKLWQHVITPIATLAIINFAELLFNGRKIEYQLPHFLIELFAIIITYNFIVVVDYLLKQAEIKHEAGFWSDIKTKMKIINADLIGIHTSDLGRMFELTGLKYFMITLKAFNAHKAAPSPYKFSRILLIYDKNETDPKNTQFNIDLKRPSMLTKSEQKIQLYDMMHEDSGIELFVITQKKLHYLLVKLKEEASLTAADKAELEKICPCDLQCKKLNYKCLDGLLLNKEFYPTMPSIEKGLKFEKEDHLKNIVNIICRQIISDPTNSIKAL